MPLLLIVGVLNSVISLYYYLRPVVAMYSTDGQTASTPVLAASSSGEAVASTSGGLSLGVVLAITICLAGVLGMIALQYLLLPYILEAVPVSAAAMMR